MKRLSKSLVRLYPVEWRQRYGAEFEAMLEEIPPGWSAFFDLLKGAIRMQFSIPSFPRLALVLAVAGMLVGLGVSCMVTPRYESFAVMTCHYRGERSDRQALLNRIQAIGNNVLSRTSLSSVIQYPSLRLYPADMAKLPFEDVIDNMRRDIRINVAPGGSRVTFAVSFTYPDRVKAEATVQALISRFEDENLAIARGLMHQAQAGEEFQLIERLESRIAALEQRAGIVRSHMAPSSFRIIADYPALEVLGPQGVFTNPAYPNRSVFAAIGFVSGFVLAIVISIFRRRFQPAAPLPASFA